MHSQINKLYKVLFILALALVSLNSHAEKMKEFGDYVVHYNYQYRRIEKSDEHHRQTNRRQSHRTCQQPDRPAQKT